MSTPLDPALAAGTSRPLGDYTAQHFGWTLHDRVGVITLDRPERKNPLTFASYAELRDLFERLRYASDVHAIVLHGAGGNFSSGGDVHEIIGPLVGLGAPELLAFTRMTGALVLSAADRGRDRRRLRRRRCDPRHGLRPAARHRAQSHRLPVQSRGTGGVRHGCLRHAATHHRTGARQ